MIIDKFTEVGVSGSNMKWLESKGYIMPKYKDKKGRISTKKGTKIKVKISDLMKTSGIKVKVKCEDCGKERYIEYYSLAGRVNSQFLKTGETLCSKCANSRMSGKNSPAYKHGNILLKRSVKLTHRFCVGEM